MLRAGHYNKLVSLLSVWNVWPLLELTLIYWYMVHGFRVQVQLGNITYFFPLACIHARTSKAGYFTLLII